MILARIRLPPPTTSTTATTIPLICERAVAMVPPQASNVNGAAAQLTQDLAARGDNMADATKATVVVMLGKDVASKKVMLSAG